MLLADDNAVSQVMMRSFLDELGYETDVASSGDEVLQVVRDKTLSGGRYDVILMDVNTGGMDTIDCIKRLRRGEAGESNMQRQRTYVIAMSADADTERGQLVAGASSSMRKPVTLEELARQLRKAKKELDEWDRDTRRLHLRAGHAPEWARGWWKGASDRLPHVPLISFEADKDDPTVDALTTAGKSSQALAECVDAVNRFSQSPCFKHLLRRLLEECISALKVQVNRDAAWAVDADDLYACITNKLQLVIVADPCQDERHIIETKPVRGEIRIDHKLLNQLRQLSHSPTPPYSAELRVLKALVMVKLIHEVAHQHTRGLMARIRDATGLYEGEDTPYKSARGRNSIERSSPSTPAKAN